MPPVGLGVAVPGIPHRLPRRMIGRGHLEQFQERKLCLERLEGGNGRQVVGVGNRDDAIAIFRILQLVQCDHRGAHDQFLLVQDRIEQYDRRIVLFRARHELEPLTHVDHVDRAGEQVGVHQQRQRVEPLREQVERQEHDGRVGDPPAADHVDGEHGSISIPRCLGYKTTGCGWLSVIHRPSITSGLAAVGSFIT